MVNIFDFLNSVDVANHLKKLGYQFTLPEAAYIVYHKRNATLKSKFEAWKELIDTMPDCSLDQNLCPGPIKKIESFKRFLTDYMDLQVKLIKMFWDTDGALYTYKIWHDGYWSYSGNYFSDPGRCYQNAATPEEDYLFNDRILLKKQDIIQHGKHMSSSMKIEMDSFNDIYWVDGLSVLEGEDLYISDAFDCMWFDMPTPFCKGDLLVNNYQKTGLNISNPFVLDDIVTWDKSLNKQSGMLFECYMYYYAYYIYKNHDLPFYDLPHIELGAGGLYIDLEYFDLKCCEEPPDGEDLHLLTEISKALKGEISRESFTSTCSQILAYQVENKKKDITKKIEGDLESVVRSIFQ